MKKLLIFLIILYPLSVSAKYKPKNYLTFYTNTAPSIDGDLTDEVWNNVQWGSNFVEFEPNAGETPEFETAFKIMYDNNNIYVAIRCYDNEPNNIDTRLSRRDDFDGDYVGIVFDSYYDKRTGFSFVVTAAGVKNDLMYSNDGNNEDATWDPIWEVKTNTDSEGWTAEMKIPLSQLRFNPDSPVWGLNLFREVYRTKEVSTWQPIDAGASGIISQFGELSGIKNLKTKRQIEIAPYIMSGFHKYQAEDGNPFADGKDLLFNAGLDGKIGITNDFTLDFSINPDFGQVEADPSEVNLSAYETYFSEKRPFFIENSNITSVDLTWRSENMFYSRRIGKSPSYYPDIASDEYLKMPPNVTILGALKFSGKSQNGWSVGIIETLASREFATISNSDGDIRTESVEPLTNYFISRVQKDINKGNTVIGGILTSTYRDIQNENLLYKNKTSTAGGVDFTQYFNDKKYSVSGKFMMSNITGSTDAMIYQQRSPQRYFQRPDADYVEVDSSLTSMTGTYANIIFSKNGIKGLRFNLNVIYMSPSFEINDIGYLRNSDHITDIFWIGYSIPESKGIFRTFNLNFNQWGSIDCGLNYQFSGANLNFNTRFKNYWYFGAYVEHNLRGVSNTMLRGGPAFMYPGSNSSSVTIQSNHTKKFFYTFSGYYYKANFDYEAYTSLYSRINYRPIDQLSFAIEASYGNYKTEMQYIDYVEVDSQQFYIMSKLKQNTVNFTFRINFNVTPDLSIQYYGSPFISAGNNSDYKNILNTLSDDYYRRYYLYSSEQYLQSEQGFDFNTDGTIDYELTSNFNFQQFRSNLVVRWEYKPGSVLFLVWAHDQTNREETGILNFGQDIKSLFSTIPDDKFLIKFQYRFR